MCVACVGLVLVMLAGENKRVQAKGRRQGCDNFLFSIPFKIMIAQMLF